MLLIFFSVCIDENFLPNIHIYNKQLCWLSSCFAIAIRADFRQSFGGSVSIMAQCIEPQLMPNEGSGKDLQIMCGHFYVKSLLHGVICVTKCEHPSNCFFLFFFLLFLLATFRLPYLNNWQYDFNET